MAATTTRTNKPNDRERKKHCTNSHTSSRLHVSGKAGWRCEWRGPMNGMRVHRQSLKNIIKKRNIHKQPHNPLNTQRAPASRTRDGGWVVCCSRLLAGGAVVKVYRNGLTMMCAHNITPPTTPIHVAAVGLPLPGFSTQNAHIHRQSVDIRDGGELGLGIKRGAAAAAAPAPARRFAMQPTAATAAPRQHYNSMKEKLSRVVAVTVVGLRCRVAADKRR